MTHEAATASPRNVAETFRWRSHDGAHHDPKNMATRHLFYTIRMIWNNTMPAAARLPGNLYTFGPTYHRDYLLQAVKALSQELATRTDMAPAWVEQLQHMLRWLGTPQIATMLKQGEIE